MPLPSFIFNAEKETPETLARRRALAEAMLNRGQTGVASNVGEGLAQLGQALGGRIRLGSVNRAETANRSRALGALGPLLGMTPQAPAAPVADTPLTGSAGSDTLAGGTDIAGGIRNTADALGIDPVDLATAISYETAGTFNPTKGGPTTKWGKHRGLIQFGEPQAKQFGVDWKDPVGSQLGPEGAVAKYLRSTGVKPGMGMMDIYSAINAGGVGRYGASDAKNGGAPGTVADKVNTQMAGHRAKAVALLKTAQAAAPQAGPAPGAGTAMTGFPPAQAPQSPQIATAPSMTPAAPQIVPTAGSAPQAPQMAPQAPLNAYQRMMATSLGKEAGGLQAPPNRAQMAAVMGHGGNGSGGGILNSIFGGGSAPAPAPAVSPFAAPQAPASAPTPAPAGDKLGQLQSFIAGPDFAWLEPAQQKFVMDEYERERAAANPDPKSALDLEKLRLEVERLKNPKKDYLKSGETFLDPETLKPVYTPAEKAPAKPAAIQEYEYAKSQGFKGSFQDWEASKKGGMSLQMNPDGSVSFQQGGNIKPMTEAQSKDTVYATRAEGALKTFEPVANSMSELSSTMLGKVPGVGNYMKSEGYQKAEQAGREFLAAVLRKDTGAAITSQEMTEYGSVYFPAPGDSADTLTQKKASRARALAAMKAGMTPQAILAQEKALSATQPQTSITPAPATPEAPAQQQSVAPPPDAIQMLKADPSWEAVRDFNEIFGPGAAERILQEDANGRK